MMDGTNDPTVEAARTALVAINWDGFDPRPVAGMIIALSDELDHAGHTRQDVVKMLDNIGVFLATV